MAASTIHKPGRYGPCKRPCDHTDCAVNRAMVKAVCHRCGTPIGYGVPFYLEGSPPAPEDQAKAHAWERIIAHAGCVESRHTALCPRLRGATDCDC